MSQAKLESVLVMNPNLQLQLNELRAAEQKHNALPAVWHFTLSPGLIGSLVG